MRHTKISESLPTLTVVLTYPVILVTVTPFYFYMVLNGLHDNPTAAGYVLRGIVATTIYFVVFAMLAAVMVVVARKLEKKRSRENRSQE